MAIVIFESLLHKIFSKKKTKIENNDSIEIAKSDTLTQQKIEVFKPSQELQNTDKYEGTGNWNSNLSTEYNKLGLDSYHWTPISGTEDAVLKSQDNLIDLLRYYEGKSDKNYEAELYKGYNDRFNKPTYGFGLTTTAMRAIGNWDKKNKRVTNIPETQEQAYEQLLNYLNKVSLKETKSTIGKDNYNKLPRPIQAALLDYHFKNGQPIMEGSGLKKLLEDALKSNTTEAWIKVLNALVYAKPASSGAPQVDNPGIYRRSLSRVVMAAKGLKNEMPDLDAEAIDRAVRHIYEDAAACAKNNNISTSDFDRIYNGYVNPESLIEKPKPISEETVKTKILTQTSLFTAARTLKPANLQLPANIADKDVMIAIINEIALLNGMKSYGNDDNGYPKYDMLDSDSEVFLPKSVKIGNQVITLNTAQDWNSLSEVAAADSVAVAAEVKEDEIPEQAASETTAETDETKVEKKKEPWYIKAWHGLVSAWNWFIGLFTSTPKDSETEPEAGTYVVQKGDGWWKIARNVSTTDYTDHEIKILAEQIREYNNDIPLKPGDIIKLPPENVESAEEEEPEVSESSVSLMMKDLKYTSHTFNNAEGFELLTFEYEIQQGDRIYSVANKYGVDGDTILANNGMTKEDASKLQIGQKININKIVYAVKEGETTASVAEKYGLNEELLRAVNGNNEIKAGEKIEIPAYIYDVAAEDSLTSIAKNAGISLSQLKTLNGLTSDSINVGQKLLILYNNPDYNVPEDKKVTRTENGSEIQTVQNTDPANINRPYFVLQKENGKVVPTRRVFEPDPAIKGSLSGKTIILNAGHGYTASGGIDIGTNIEELKLKDDGTPKEYQCTYDNTMLLKDELLKRGARVIYMQGQVSLIQKELMNERNKADLFLSIHVNSVDPIDKNTGKRRIVQDRTSFWVTSQTAPNENLRNRSESFSWQLERRFDEWIPENETIAPKDGFYVGKDKVQDYAQHDRKPLGVCQYAEKYVKCPAVLWEVAFMAADIGRERLRDRDLMQKYMEQAAGEIDKFLNAPPDTRPRHTVKDGDNLTKIADKYGVSVKDIKEVNGLRSSVVKIGQELIIPEKKK